MNHKGLMKSILIIAVLACSQLNVWALNKSASSTVMTSEDVILNMATIGTSQSTILALFFGRDEIRFSHTWDGAGGATRSYAGFTAMANEQERARVYGGIHFTFDNMAEQSIGRSVGYYVFQNVMRPKECVR